MIPNEILTLIREQLNAPGLGLDDPLEKNGMDSMAMVRIFLAIEKQHGIWLEGEDLKPENIATVRTLSARVEQRLAEKNP